MMKDYRIVQGAYPGRTYTKHGRTRLTRVLGADTAQTASPFMLLDVVSTEHPEDLTQGMPWQPYTGIESFLYFLDATRVRDHAAPNVDSPGWVCCASGEWKEELPALTTPCIGTQLWVWPNSAMPSPLNACPGRTMLPMVTLESTVIRVVAGTFADQLGAIVLPQSGITYLDVYVAPKTQFTFDAFENDPILLYILEGEAYLTLDEDELFPQGRAVMMSPGKEMLVTPTRKGIRFLLIHAPAVQGDVPVLDMNAVHRSEEEWEEIVRD